MSVTIIHDPTIGRRKKGDGLRRKKRRRNPGLIIVVQNTFLHSAARLTNVSQCVSKASMCNPGKGRSRERD